MDDFEGMDGNVVDVDEDEDEHMPLAEGFRTFHFFLSNWQHDACCYQSDLKM
jgi:hypothetical protein